MAPSKVRRPTAPLWRPAAGALLLAATAATAFAQRSAQEPAAPPPSAPVTPTAALRDDRLFVAAESSDEVYQLRFDGAALHVDAVVPVGYQATEVEGPHGLAVDVAGEHWYVSIAHGKPNGRVYKYETGTNRLLGEVELGLFPASMQISRDTGLLYCVNFDLHGEMKPSTVSVVDVDAMVEVAATTTGPMPHGSRCSPDGTRHYSCAMMSDEIFELDAATFEVLRSLRLDDGTGGIARPGKDGHHKAVTKPTWIQPHPTREVAYVCLNGSHQVVEVDLAKWAVARRFPTARGPYNVEVTPDGERLVVTHKGVQAVSVWDLAKAKELARIETTRRVGHGVVVTPDSRFAFVSNEGVGAQAGTVDAIDLASLRRVATAEIGLQAGGIALWKSEGALR